MSNMINVSESSSTHWIWTIQVHNADGSLANEIIVPNLIPDVAKNAFAQQIAGLNSRDIGQNIYIALGTSAASPTNADTTLGSESTRILAGVFSVSANAATIKAFFGQTVAPGTWREFGMFQNGATTICSSAANSGILFSKVSSNVTVGSTQTLTVTITYTFV